MWSGNVLTMPPVQVSCLRRDVEVSSHTTPAGDAYTFPEYQKMFRAAGFTQTECSNLEPTMQQVIVATR